MVGSLSLVLTQFSPQLSNGSVLCGEHLLHVLILRGRVKLELQLLRGTGVIGRTVYKHKYTLIGQFLEFIYLLVVHFRLLLELNEGDKERRDTNYFIINYIKLRGFSKTNSTSNCLYSTHYYR